MTTLATVAGEPIGVLAVMAVAVLLGAMTQTTVGLGLGLVSAPVLTFVAPELMPGVIIMMGMALPLLTLLREHHDIDWHGVRWLTPWRILGTVGGVWIVTQVTAEALERIVGVVVLIAVGLTVHAFAVPMNRGTLGVAGFISGVTGTATSIGGPPVALLYQHRPPHQVRSTLAVIFVTGSAISLTGLGVSGELTLQELQVAAVLVPVLASGVALGTLLRSRLPLSVMRPALLGVSAISAVVLIVKSFV